MPATTPTGITYPCSGDTINSAVFATYAQTTQLALNVTQNLVSQALQPPGASVQTASGGVAVAAGVITTISYGQVMYDTNAMFNLATPTIVTIQSPGSYLVNLHYIRSTTPAGLTSARIAILLNGAELAYMKQDAGTQAIMSGIPWNASAFLPSLIVGDQITSTNLFTGSGSMNVRHFVTVTKITNV